MMKPTKYEYAPPLQIAGVARDFTTRIEISQTASGTWTGTVNITSIPLETSADVQGKLRDELMRLADQLGGSR